MKHIFYPQTYGDKSMDTFRLDSGHHNGPECMICNKSECYHCVNWIDEDCPAKEHQISRAIEERENKMKEILFELELIKNGMVKKDGSD